MFDGRNKALAGHVMVQSNAHGPEYLESRMNLVLKDLASMKEPFTADQVKKMKDKELATLSQKAQNLASETDKYWTYLQRDYVDDQSKSIQNVRGLLKEAFQKVTVEKLNEVFRSLFATNVRRFNLKLSSKNHEKTDDFK